MDEEPNKIKQHINIERAQLGRNLDEIGDRVHNATDLKARFDKNTAPLLGAAVVGGFLLSLAFRKSSGSRRTSNSESESRIRSANVLQGRPSVSTHLHRVSDTLDNMFGALVGVASEKLHSFVADVVPGFREQYDAIDRQRGRSSISQMRSNVSNESDPSAVNL